MKTARVLLIVAALLTGAAFLARSQAQAPPKPAAPIARVAVCDVAELLKRNEASKDMEAVLRARQQAANREDEKRVEEIRKVKAVLDALKPGAKPHADQRRKFRKLVHDRRVWRAMEEEDFTELQRQMMQAVYRDILAAVADVARAEGYDIVLHRETAPIKSQDPAELLAKIAQRKCLHANARFDITQLALKLLDERHKAGRAKPAKP